MNIQDVIEKIENEFDELPKGQLTADSEFKNLINWNSINAVVITTMIEYEFGVLVLPLEMNNVRTVRELFELIKLKRG